MANKPLKAIKFPGLVDTYTIPEIDDTLSVSGMAADAAAVASAIDGITPESIGARPDTWLPTASDIGAATEEDFEVLNKAALTLNEYDSLIEVNTMGLAQSQGMYNWTSIAYGNGKYVAVSSDAHYAVSDNGVDWNIGNTILTEGTKCSICFGNGIFLASSNADGMFTTLAYSTDGINWSGGQCGESLIDICYGNDKFVAITNSNRVLILNGNDPFDFVDEPQKSVIHNNSAYSSWDSITYGNGKFVIVGGTYFELHPETEEWFHGVFSAYSTDGINWSTVKMSDGDGTWGSVTYGNGKFVAASSYQSFMTWPTDFAYSDDGITWNTSQQFIDYSNSNSYIHSVTYGGSKFVATRSDGKIYQSEDGVTWSVLLDDTSHASEWTDVCYGNNKFITIGKLSTECVIEFHDYIKAVLQYGEEVKIPFNSLEDAAPAGYGLGETLFDSNKYILATWGESFESYCAQINARLEEMDNYSFRFVLARGIQGNPNPYEKSGNVMAILYRGASANAGQLIALASEGSRPMWRMSKTSGVWSDIEWFDPPMYSGVAYRTTKRVGNLPVYVASFSGGEIPSAGGERWIGLPVAEYWDGTESGWYERTVSSVLSIKGCIDDTIANYYTLDDSRIVNSYRVDWGGSSTGTLVIDYNSTALSFIRETAGDSSVVPTVTIRVEFAGY